MVVALSLSSNCMQPRGIAYGIPRESRPAGAEKSNNLCRVCIYVVGESTEHYEREEESRNRKRFTPTHTFTSYLIILSRVEDAGKGDGNIALSVHSAVFLER